MNRIPADLAERLKTNPFRKPNRYVDWNGVRLLAETVCKVCGVALTAIAPDPRIPPMKRELKGTKTRTVILETYVSRMKTSAFDTIRFELEEKSGLGAHRTVLCTSCKQELLDGKRDLEEVQWMYDADLERIAVEDEVNGVHPERTHSSLVRLAARKVVRILG